MRKLFLIGFLCIGLLTSLPTSFGGGYIGATAVQWSPTGDYLLYYADCVALNSCGTDQPQGYFLLDTTTGESTHLLEGGYQPDRPMRWSADGRRFALQNMSNGLYIGSVTGETLHDYPNLPTLHWQFMWVGDEPQLITTTALGTDLPETVVDLGIGRYPIFAPDQQWMAAGTEDGLTLTHSAIGTQHDFPGLSDEELIWSPDSRFMATYNVAQDVQVIVTVADQSRFVINTLVPEAFDFFGSWSPDSQRYAVYSGSAWDIHIVDLTTQQVQVITGSTPAFQISPTGHLWWSPDGQQVAFVEAQIGGEDSRPARMCIVTLATEARLCSPFYEMGWHEAWSPDSRTFVFNGYQDEMNTLYFMRLDTNTVQRYDLAGADNREPITLAWSPNGERLAFLPVSGEMPVQIMTTEEMLRLPAIP